MEKWLLIFRIIYVAIMVLGSVLINLYYFRGFIIEFSTQITIDDEYYKYSNAKKYKIEKALWKRFIIIQSILLIICGLVYFFATPNLILLSAKKNIILLGMLSLSCTITKLLYKHCTIDSFIDKKIFKTSAFFSIISNISIVIFLFSISNLLCFNKSYNENKLTEFQRYNIVIEENEYLKHNDIVIKKEVINDKTNYSFYCSTSSNCYKLISTDKNDTSFIISDSDENYICIYTFEEDIYDSDYKEPKKTHFSKEKIEYEFCITKETFDSIIAKE